MIAMASILHEGTGHTQYGPFLHLVRKDTNTLTPFHMKHETSFGYYGTRVKRDFYCLGFSVFWVIYCSYMCWIICARLNCMQIKISSLHAETCSKLMGKHSGGGNNLVFH